MNSEKEIFVLGAGASACFGLPMWNELAELILEKLGSKKNEEVFDQFPEDHYLKAMNGLKKLDQIKNMKQLIFVFSKKQKN